MKLVAADRILCPRCGEPLRRVTIGEGYLLATCERKVRTRPPVGDRPPLSETCAQHVYVWGHGYGAATVVAITRDEAEILNPGGVTRAPGEALAILGVLRTRCLEAVPVLACARCRCATKQSDMFDGVCRWCLAEPEGGEDGGYL